MAVTQPVGGQWTDSSYGSGGSGSAYPLNLDAMLAVLKRLGQRFNAHQSSPAAMTVTLDAGWIWDPFASTLTEVAAQTTGTIVAPVSQDRIDRVVVDTKTGAVSVVTGVENASPVPQPVPPGKEAVAQILLHTSTTAITNTTNISDERGTPGPSNLVAQAQAFDSPYSGGL